MHLLIVDDEVMIRNGIKHMVSSYGKPFSTIRLAENGEQALAMIAERPPDLVITDIRMPRMDGLELSRNIHELYGYITVVIISGFAEFEYAKKCVAYGVKEYLLKPVVKKDIHEMLDKLLPGMEKSVVAPTQAKKWLDEMTEHMWQLQTKEMERCLEDWLAYCRERTEHPEQLRALLQDSCHGVLDRLKEKGHHDPQASAPILKGSFEEVMEAFREQIRSIAGELTARRGGFKDLMAEAKAYIDQNIGKEVTLEEVANLVGLTPNYFSMFFKKATGVTFINYRMTRRMELAEQLLALPHYRIVDVAHEVGYEDYSHFAKTFRKMKGLSPTEYRSRLGIK